MENPLVMTELNQNDIDSIASEHLKIEAPDNMGPFSVDNYVDFVKRMKKTFGKNKDSA